MCSTSNISSVGGIETEGCLGWKDINRPLDDIMKPTETTINNNDGKVEFERVMNWRYEDGLLRSVVDGDAGLCLGPSLTSKNQLSNEFWAATTLREQTCKPYELVLQDCPNGTDLAFPQPDNLLADTRHMRFLITEEGRVQSLAPVLDRTTGKDIMGTTKPYCLTIMKWYNDRINKSYLIPCLDDNKVQDAETKHIMKYVRGPQQQIFDVHGSSGSFVMPLQSDWGYQNVVQLAYQNDFSTSLLENNHTIDHYIEITNDQWSMDDTFVGTFEAQARSGIISFSPSEFKVDGTMHATMLGRIEGSEDHYVTSTSFVVVSEATGNDSSNGSSFMISGATDKDSNGSNHLIFAILGGLVGCIILLALAGKFFCSKTRGADTCTTMDENNDGKTVHTMTKEGNDLGPDDIEENEDTGVTSDDDDERTANDSSINDDEHDSITTANDEDTHRDAVTDIPDV